MRLLDAHSHVPVRVLVDAYAREVVAAAAENLDVGDKFRIESKLAHADFIRALRRAEFIVTDSGGKQEEAALYGVPTLAHRMATERSDGLGQTAVLSRWQPEIMVKFLMDYRRLRVQPSPPAVSPSDVVVADLIARGYGSYVHPARLARP